MLVRLICSRTKSISNLSISYWRFLFSYLSKLFVLLACLYLNLSKNSSLTAFFRKADAKVRTFSELPKLFRRKFSKSFFDRLFTTLSLFQHFNLSAFLSRKRVQNYCFTAYAPNIPASFFQGKCDFSPKSLILKRCRKAGFNCAFLYIQAPIPYYLYARTQANRPDYLHSCNRPITLWLIAQTGWQDSLHRYVFPVTGSKRTCNRERGHV